MSIDQAQQFYGFLEAIFESKLAPVVQKVIQDRLSGAFSFKIDEEEYKVIFFQVEIFPQFNN